MHGVFQTNDDGEPPHQRDMNGMKTLNQRRWTCPQSTFHFIDHPMTDLASDADAAGWQNTLKRTLRDVPILRSLPVGGDAGRVVTRTTPRNVGLIPFSDR